MTRRVTVVGAGVAGLAIAWELARADFAVEVVGELADSASAAAAGMLAPASEALLDDMTAADAAILLRARRLWDDWAARLRIALDTAGTLHVGPATMLEARAAQAERLELRAERDGAGLRFAQEAVLDCGAALGRLRAAAVEAGAELRPGRVEADGGRLCIDGRALDGEVVVAAGWGSVALVAGAPELAGFQPIRGQLLRLAAARGEGPVIRAPDVYLAPAVGGWTVGATMEPGRSDLAADGATSRRLRAAAVALRPELARATGAPAVGVRAASPDARPLVGRSRAGPWLATGLRRNGWLLAPLVAEALRAALTRGDVAAVLGEAARTWDPRRFGPDIKSGASQDAAESPRERA